VRAKDLRAGRSSLD